MQKNKMTSFKEKKKGKKHKRHCFNRIIFYWSTVIGLWIIILFIIYIFFILLTMPEFSVLEIPVRPPNIRIIDRHGSFVSNRGIMGSEAISFKRISHWIAKAVVAIEDRRFYSHNGLDPIAISRAVVINLVYGNGRQGASTLTQQLAKNLFLSSERTFDRKMREAVFALWLEHKLGKDQILELYLNRVYLGSGIYGVEAASRRYFNKSSKDVTMLEAATLAGLLKAPSRFSPEHNPKAAYERAQVVLAAMHEEKMISDNEYATTSVKPMIKVISCCSNSENYVADYVVSQLPSLIGALDNDIIVETTLDLQLQKTAEKSIHNQIQEYKKMYNVTQGALISIDRDGAIRAMVGGVNYFKSQYNRATEAKRQPGSAFKPFVYLAALEQGCTPNSVRNDAPVKIGKWSPRNAGNRYMGKVTLTKALSHSLNSVAVRLIMEVRPEAVIKVAHRLGIHSGLTENASIALGTSEVSLLELTGAFIPFSNGGYKPQVHLIRKITDSSHKRVLYDIGDVTVPRVIHPHIVRMMNAMLKQTITTGTAKRANIGRSVAGKTGTSQNFRDAWFIGYTADYVTGVWFGNDNGGSMNRVSGSSLPVSVWKTYMKEAEKGKPLTILPGS